MLDIESPGILLYHFIIINLFFTLKLVSTLFSYKWIIFFKLFLRVIIYLLRMKLSQLQNKMPRQNRFNIFIYLIITCIYSW